MACKTQQGNSSIVEALKPHLVKQYSINPDGGEILEKGTSPSQFELIGLPEIPYSIRIPNNMYLVTRTKYTRGIDTTGYKIPNKDVRNWMIKENIYLLGCTELEDQNSIIAIIIVSAFESNNSSNEIAAFSMGFQGNKYIFENTFIINNNLYFKYGREGEYYSYYLYITFYNNKEVKIEVMIKGSKSQYDAKFEETLFS